MKGGTLLLYPAVSIIMIGCSKGHSNTTIKDLDENMLDLKIYQENLGDMIKSGRLNDAEWLLDGTDSLLQVISNTFKEHRKLHNPFSYYYKNKLKEPLRRIEKAIRDNNMTDAVENYRVLVKRCNNCHIDHDIDKEVKF